MNNTETSKIIKDIINMKGLEILNDAKCFNALFNDLAPELVEESRIFHRVLNDEVLSSFYKVYLLESFEQSNELLKIDKQLRDFFGFSDVWSYLVVSSFADAIGCENPLSEVNISENAVSINNAESNVDLLKISSVLRRKIATGSYHALGITESGQVIAVGFNGNGQCEVSTWNDIVEVSADTFHSVGLRRDGTVVSTQIKGDSVQRFNVGQCNVSSWRSIVSISAGTSHTIGLKKDGTVVAVGENRVGQCNVSEWKDIVAIDAGGVVTAGLKKDGTVVVTGGSSFGQNNVQGWSDVIQIAVAGTQVMGLKKDGTLLTTMCSGDRDHGQCSVTQWKDIVSISTTARMTLGLKKDGTVVSTKYYGEPKFDFGQTNVNSWNDVIAVSASPYFAIGLKKDGSLHMVGDSKYGQDRVASWKLFNSLEKYMTTSVQISVDVPTQNDVNEIPNKQPLNTNDSPNYSLIKEIDEEIIRLKDERNSLGIFSGKRKKEIDDQIQHLNQRIQELSNGYSSTSPFKMLVQDMFAIKGRGTVLVGQIEKGKLNKDDTVIINGKQDVVTAIECNRKLLNYAESSDGNIGVLLKNITLSDVKVGDCIYK